MVAQPPLAIWATSAKTPTPSGHWGRLQPWRVPKPRRGGGGPGLKAGACAPAPAHPKGPVLDNFFCHLSQTPERSIGPQALGRRRWERRGSVPPAQPSEGSAPGTNPELSRKTRQAGQILKLSLRSHTAQGTSLAIFPFFFKA